MWLYLNTLTWLCDQPDGQLSFWGGGRDASPKRRLDRQLQRLPHPEIPVTAHPPPEPTHTFISCWQASGQKGFRVINGDEEKHFVTQAVQTWLPLFYWPRILEIRPGGPAKLWALPLLGNCAHRMPILFLLALLGLIARALPLMDSPHVSGPTPLQSTSDKRQWHFSLSWSSASPQAETIS